MLVLFLVHTTGPASNEMKSSVLELVCGLGISAPMLAAALFLFLVVFNTIWTVIKLWMICRRSQKWPSTEGRILEMHLKLDPGPTGSHRHVLVNYRYSVNGVQHDGDRMVFSSSSSYTTKEAENIVAKYPKGSTVTIYYDPDHPKSCTLERIHQGLISDLFVSLFMAIPAIALTALGILGIVQSFRPKT